MSFNLERTIDEDAITRLATTLRVSATDMRVAAELSVELPAPASIADIGARLLVGLGAVSTDRASAEAIGQLAGMTFQLEHGEQGRANWIGHREAGRPFAESFLDQLSHVVGLAAGDGADAKLTMGWGSAGYGEFEMTAERVSFLYATNTLFGKGAIKPGVVRLNSIEVDWTRKFVVEKDALARYARTLHGLA